MRYASVIYRDYAGNSLFTPGAGENNGEFYLPYAQLRERFLAAGIDTLAVTSKVPQFYALASNDDTLGAVGIQTARDSSQLLLGRGVPTGVVATTVSPLYSGRLRSLALTAPFTADDAQAVWSALKTAKIIDENSYPATSASAATVSAALPAAYRGRAADIAAEIAVAAAEREFFSEGNSRVINFLNNRASDAPPPPPGPLPEATRTTLRDIADPELRATLQSLAEALATSNGMPKIR